MRDVTRRAPSRDVSLFSANVCTQTSSIFQNQAHGSARAGLVAHWYRRKHSYPTARAGVIPSLGVHMIV